jgi:hypothetical protein
MQRRPFMADCQPTSAAVARSLLHAGIIPEGDVHLHNTVGLERSTYFSPMQ